MAVGKAASHDATRRDDAQIERVQFQRRATPRAVWTGLKPETPTAAGSYDIIFFTFLWR